MQNLKSIHLKYKEHILDQFNYTVDFSEFIEILKENNFFKSHINDNYYFLNIINDCNVSVEMIENAMLEDDMI